MKHVSEAGGVGGGWEGQGGPRRERKEPILEKISDSMQGSMYSNERNQSGDRHGMIPVERKWKSVGANERFMYQRQSCDGEPFNYQCLKHVQLAVLLPENLDGR